MMGSRPVREPAELVIWSASALLGLVVGIGTAFILWSQLHRGADQVVLDGAIIAIATGLSLVAVAVDNVIARLFIWAACAAMVIAFFAGATMFASLVG
ncbi:MAG: hypothetical protein JO322_08755 [Candidatus Eremiobacteraeota bacterium]|nr:hypothetical protein [Candidatus Eremiobacteraeota bacterium]